MWICGYDIAQSDPDTAHVDRRALRALEFLVVSDIFENETSRFADVVLPAAAFLEKSGTFTNAERRIQLVQPAVEPPGGAKTDLEIFTQVAARLGHPFPYDGPADVMAEIARLTPELRRGDLRAARPPWAPVAGRRDGADTPILLSPSASSSRSGRARLAALPYRAPGERGERRVPAHPRHRPAARALQRRHDDAPYRQPRAALRTSGSRSIPTTRARLGIADGDLVEVRSRERLDPRSRRGSPTGSSPGQSSRRSTSPRCARISSSGSRPTSTRAAPSTRWLAVSVRRAEEDAGAAAGSGRGRLTHTA